MCARWETADTGTAALDFRGSEAAEEQRVAGGWGQQKKQKTPASSVNISYE